MELQAFNSLPDSCAFIGGGQMATALISGLLKSGMSPASIAVVEPNAEQRERLHTLYGVNTFAVADERLQAAKVLVWAVKPQVMRQAIQPVQQLLCDPLHISIAAGVRCSDLSLWLGSNRIVRAMPNTPALVGEAVTGLMAFEATPLEDRSLAEQVLQSVGFCLWVDTDEELNAITAVSGSGPAYIFHFLEGFQAAAQAVGFDAATARELVLRTAAGAVKQAQLGDSFGQMRERVTSKRGTTEAALERLNAAGTAAAIEVAVLAACERAGVLSKELSAPI